MLTSGAKLRNRDADHHHCTETQLASALGVAYQVSVLRPCPRLYLGFLPFLNIQKSGARVLSPSW